MNRGRVYDVSRCDVRQGLLHMERSRAGRHAVQSSRVQTRTGEDSRAEKVSELIGDLLCHGLSCIF